jgi:light-regulated signal transduction histidine kinase (bacteriophytochrome)
MAMETEHKLVLEVDPESGTIERADEALEAALGFAPGTLSGEHCSLLAQPRAGVTGPANDATAELFLDCTHDLVAPLNQVSVLIALLIRKNEAVLTGPDSQEILENIETSVKRMRNLAEGMKRLSRMLSEPISAAPVDAASLLAGAVRNCGRRFDAGDFEIVSGPLPCIAADGRRMEFVFEELLENAIKYRARTPVRIQIGATAGAGQWTFSVRDDGPGFDARWSQEAFRIFRRMDPGAAVGSGVGLTICKRIIGLHHGEMWAESEPARGTTLYFTLPQLPQSGPRRTDAAGEREGTA